MIIVIGRIWTRTWEDDEGKKRYATEVVANEVSFGESKRSGGSVPNTDGNGFEPLDAEDDDLPF